MNSTPIEVVVITYNSSSYLEACLDSILQNGAAATVVDNGSTDRTVALVRQEYPNVRLIENVGNLGYAAAVNQGMNSTGADIVAVCNADVVYPPDSLHQLIRFMQANPEVGAAGPQLVFPDGGWQGSYGSVHGIMESLKRTIGLTSLHNWLRRLWWPRKLDRSAKHVGYVIGAVMAIRRRAFDAVGGWDEEFYFYAEDVDFCHRLHRAGWQVMFVPTIEVMHIAGASSTKVDASERYFRQLVQSELLLVRKNRAPWQVSIYKYLSRFSCLQMWWAWRIVAKIGSGPIKAQASSRTLAFSRLSRIWREECRR